MRGFIVISGCSGGGKSSLLAELARRGFAVVEEPGRRIVAEEIAGAGAALPWVDLAAFARRALRMAIEDRERAGRESGLVFFDRGLVDAAVALQHATGEPAQATLRAQPRYDSRVFMTPPWREIYVGDAERRHGFDAAVAEYERLAEAYPLLGYRLDVLPRASVAERADFVLNRLEISDQSTLR